MIDVTRFLASFGEYALAGGVYSKDGLRLNQQLVERLDTQLGDSAVDWLPAELLPDNSRQPRLLFGREVPVAADGFTGDVWVRTTTGAIYEKESADTWTLRIATMGAPGADGADGSSWYGGAGAPATGLGRLYDWYLNYTTGDVSFKSAEAIWTTVANIMGPAGADGVAGEDGDPGAPGASWYSVSGAPAGGLGVIGDWAVDTATGNVYMKTAEATWTLQFTMLGGGGGGGGEFDYGLITESSTLDTDWGTII